MMKREVREKAERFTAAEFLIVALMAGILIMMFLPALTKAKEISGDKLCQNNLNQIGKALALYAQDYNNYLPMVTWPSHNPRNRWHERLVDLGYITDKSVYICPVTANIPGMLSDLCYIPNGSLIGGFYVENKPNFKSTADVQVPSETVAVTDRSANAGPQGFSATGCGWPMTSDSRVGYYHDDGVNVLWADWHVSYQKGGSLGSGGDDIWWKLRKR